MCDRRPGASVVAHRRRRPRRMKRADRPWRDPMQGRLLYLVARSLRAQRIVEFGTSFGISTTYLAAAVRDNGGHDHRSEEVCSRGDAALEHHVVTGITASPNPNGWLTVRALATKAPVPATRTRHCSWVILRAASSSPGTARYSSRSAGDTNRTDRPINSRKAARGVPPNARAETMIPVSTTARSATSSGGHSPPPHLPHPPPRCHRG